MKRSAFRVAAVVSAALLAACSGEREPEVPEGPVTWGVEASVDKTEVQVGEELTLSLTVSHPPEASFLAPTGADLEPFALIEQSEVEVSPTTTRVDLRLAPFFLPDDVEIPAVEVRYRDESGELVPLQVAAIPVQVVTSLSPDVTEIHDIKEPLALAVPRELGLWWWLLLALLAAALAYIIYTKLRKETEVDAAQWVAPPPPPYEEALAALRRLEDKGLLDKGEVVLFYEELTEIAKRYAGRRFEVAYLERTTWEILEDLRAKKLRGESYASFRRLLEASDLIKFAKQIPDPAGAGASYAEVEAFLERTRPKPAVPASSSDDSVEVPA